MNRQPNPRVDGVDDPLGHGVVDAVGGLDREEIGGACTTADPDEADAAVGVQAVLVPRG